MKVCPEAAWLLQKYWTRAHCLLQPLAKCLDQIVLTDSRAQAVVYEYCCLIVAQVCIVHAIMQICNMMIIYSMIIDTHTSNMCKLGSSLLRPTLSQPIVKPDKGLLSGLIQVKLMAEVKLPVA